MKCDDASFASIAENPRSEPMASSSENRPFILRLQERIAASRFLTFSLFLHLIIVALAGGIVLIHRNSAPDFPPEARILIQKTDDGVDQTVTKPTLQDPQVSPPANLAPTSPTFLATTTPGPTTIPTPALADARTSKVLNRLAQSNKVLAGQPSTDRKSVV